MRPHRVETWWTTATWTAMCLDCPWQAEGSHEQVTRAAEAHAPTAPVTRREVIGRATAT